MLFSAWKRNKGTYEYSDKKSTYCFIQSFHDFCKELESKQCNLEPTN